MRTTLLVGVALLLAACGRPEPEVAIQSPTTSELTVPYGVGVIEGRLENAGVLRVEVVRGDDTYAFDALPGWRLAVEELPSKAEGAAPETLARILAEDEIQVEFEKGATPDAFVLQVRDPERLADIVARTGRGADLVCAIEVRPSNRYRWRDDGNPIPRLASEPLWPGTEIEFDAWKQSEVTRWKKAEAEGSHYESSRDDMRVVPREDGDGFVVVSADERDVIRMDATVVKDPVVSRSPMGRPVVLCSIREVAQSRLRDLTTRNLGLPMALILDGRCDVAPVIQSPLTDSIQVTLGSGKAYAELLADVEALTEGLRRGGMDTRLVAAAHVGTDERFRVLVPPTKADAVVRLTAVGRAGSSTPLAIRMRLRPGVEVAPVQSVDAVLAGLQIGWVKPAAAAALLKPRVEMMGPELEARLPDASPALRSRLVEVLARLGRDAAVVHRLRHDGSTVVRESAARFTSDVEALRAALQTETEPEVLIAVSDGIGKLDEGATLVPDLVRAAAKQEPRLRSYMASQAVGFLPGCRKALHEAATAGDQALRLTVIPVLDHDKSAETLNLLLRLLEQPDAETRALVLRVLHFWIAPPWGERDPSLNVEGPEVVAAIAARLDDADRKVRAGAMFLLSRLGEDGQTVILPRLGDSDLLDPMLQVGVFHGNKTWRAAGDARLDEVLKRLEDRSDPSSGVLHAYLVWLRTSDVAPLRAALEALGDPGEDKARAATAKTLRALVEDPGSGVR